MSGIDTIDTAVVKFSAPARHTRLRAAGGGKGMGVALTGEYHSVEQ